MTETFSVEAFIFVIILIIYVLTSRFIEIKKVPYMHESAIAIFMGMMTAIFAKYVLNQAIQFSNQIFFAIILPPIIFSAGYSLRKSLFFQNFGMTSFLGVIGTIIGFICLTFLIMFINSFFQALDLTQIMMISSVLCATDTVAAMSLIKPTKYPVLNAVLFGQGIINDAVAIILFRTVTELDLGEAGQFTYKTILQMIFDFCYLFFFSLALGSGSGFGLSYLFKVNDSFMKYSIKQTSLILLNGYLTYLLGELLGLSGIISLFTCAIIMGHYCFMNISEESQRGTGLAFQTVSYIAEAFVFAYLGASVFGVEGNWQAVGMGFLILLVLPLIRAIMVYLLPLLYAITRRKFPMTQKQLKICWYAGMVRGVIAFALCLQISPQNNRDFIVTVTLQIVMVTTFIGAMMLKSFVKYIGMQQNDSDDQQQSIKQNSTKQQKSPISNYNSIGMEVHPKPTDQQLDSQRRKANNKFQYWQKQYINPIFRKNSQKLIYQLQDRDKNQKGNQMKVQQI